MLKLGNQSSSAPWARVVGVSAEANLRSFNEIDRNLPQPPEVYVVRKDPRVRNLRLVFRVAPNDKKTPIQLVHAVKEAAGLKQNALLRVWSGNFDYYLSSVRFATRVFLVLALCALGLAAVGLYGVVIYSVNRRMREFGVRIALGATGSILSRMVARDVFAMYLAGTAAGAFAAMLAAQSIDSLLYRVNPTDVGSLVLSETILASAALLACLVPARRAAKADPVEILRAT
jgi:ABC-type antimicrobial peptide transport system permease subunit